MEYFALRWIDLFEVAYQLIRIPAFSVNRPSRLTKKPKVYWFKATTSPSAGDASGLRAFLTQYPDIAIGGLLVHGGDDIVRLAKDVVAVPWWRVM